LATSGSTARKLQQVGRHAHSWIAGCAVPNVDGI